MVLTVDTTTASTASPPRIYVANRRIWMRAAAQPPLLIDDISEQVVERGGILPLRRDPDDFHKWAGGVVDADGAFVAGQLTDPARDDNPRNIVNAYPYSGEWERRRETVIWGGGRNVTHFGHALLEWPARLWWRIANQAAGSRIRVAFAIRGMTHEHPLVELLLRAGLSRDDILFIERPTRFSKIIVPDQALYPSGHISLDGSRTVYDHMRDSVSASDVKKVYLTRSQLPPMPRIQTLNEDVVEREFERRGFTIVAPEKLKLQDQIALLAGADEVATTGGTLSHLVAFCRDDAKLHLLPRVHSSAGTTAVPRVQWSLNLMRSIDLTVVEAIRRPVLPVSREWGVTDFGLTSQLERFLAAELDGRTPPPATDAAPAYSDAELGRVFREWAALVERTPQHVQRAIPPVTVDSLAAAVTRMTTPS